MVRLVPTLAAFTAAFACYVVLTALGARFELGSTWSGLNPDGGGPGFLIIIIPCIFSLLSRPSRVRTLRPVAATFEAAFNAAVCGVTLWFFLVLLPPFESPDAAALASASTGGFLVPRIIASVLGHAWSMNDDPTVVSSTTDSGSV